MGLTPGVICIEEGNPLHRLSYPIQPRVSGTRNAAIDLPMDLDAAPETRVAGLQIVLCR